MRDLAEGSFLTQQRNVIFIGGTGASKTHLAIAIGRNGIRAGKRGRIYKQNNLFAKWWQSCMLLEGKWAIG